MYEKLKIKPPFFEIGPKAYLYGQGSLDLAKAADELSEKYDVMIIYTPQYVDIPKIAGETKRILVFAQHMDSVEIGRGIGTVLPESVKAAGAVGTLLNHAEKRCTLTEIYKTIQRADEVGLGTLVCADSPKEAAAIAQLSPNIILAEPPELIGTGQSVVQGSDFVTESTKLIKGINPDVQILHSAGIRSGEDVADIIRQGAEATGVTSGIVKADDPFKAMEDMIKSLRETWDELH